MKKNFLPLLSFCLFTIGTYAQQVKVDNNAIEAAKTEQWTPVPKVVTPGATSTGAPSDAIILFNGKNLDAFQKKGGGAPGWKIDPDGALTDVKGAGDLETKKSFGDCQLHIEWRTNIEIKGNGQSRSNSGVFLMSNYEIQVLDSYNSPTYVNGQAGALYKQHAPLVNACREPGAWQTYDIIFAAPQFREDGEVATPGHVTVLHNGVLIQNNATIFGVTEWIGLPKYKKHASKMPLYLQDHGDDGKPISYRNIWIREL